MSAVSLISAGTATRCRLSAAFDTSDTKGFLENRLTAALYPSITAVCLCVWPGFKRIPFFSQRGNSLASNFMHQESLLFFLPPPPLPLSEESLGKSGSSEECDNNSEICLPQINSSPTPPRGRTPAGIISVAGESGRSPSQSPLQELLTLSHFQGLR